MLWLAYFLAVVNAVIIGISFLFIKVAVTHASPIDTLAFRFIVALAFCVVYMRLAKIPLRIDFKRLFLFGDEKLEDCLGILPNLQLIPIIP